MLLGFVLVGCSRSPSTGQPEPMDAEILVATVALSEFVGEPDSVGVLELYRSLEARTAQFSDSAAWTAAMDTFGLRSTRYPTLIGSYWRANRRPRALHRPLRVPGWRVRLVDAQSEHSPDVRTIHYVSRVGITPTGDSALVAVDALCGLLCGHGVLVLYIRKQSGWHFASTLQMLRY